MQHLDFLSNFINAFWGGRQLSYSPKDQLKVLISVPTDGLNVREKQLNVINHVSQFNALCYYLHFWVPVKPLAIVHRQALPPASNLQINV